MVWLNAKIHMVFVFKHQLEIIWTRSPYEDVRGLQYWSQDCPAVLRTVQTFEEDTTRMLMKMCMCYQPERDNLL